MVVVENKARVNWKSYSKRSGSSENGKKEKRKQTQSTGKSITGNTAKQKVVDLTKMVKKRGGAHFLLSKKNV